jgi:cell division protein ZapE
VAAAGGEEGALVFLERSQRIAYPRCATPATSPAAPLRQGEAMLVEELESRVAVGDLDFDPLQRAAAERLDRLARELEGYEPTPLRASGGLLARLVRHQPAPPPRGLYIHGDVGRGKSMLMDLFFASAPIERKRRTHFHAFMIEVQKRLHAMREAGSGEDPLVPLAAEIAAATSLLCFDEFHVSDIADAMILGRLFTGLLDRGVVVVATSNWPPRRLYENGLNRDRFLPFIELLLARLDVVALEGPVDYRLRRLKDLPVYQHPLGPEARASLERIFDLLIDGQPARPEAVEVGRRHLVVPRAAAGVAWLDFQELCARPLGAADYLALTERFHTLILENVPLLTPDRRNEARRFMTLVDALYERRMMLFLSAESPPEALYPEGDGAFEFRRTVSRLMEMQSRGYLESCRDRHPDRLPKSFTPFALTSDLV